MSTTKDLFSGHSQAYAKFRPTYPKELFEYLSSLTAKHDLAWDCGTGNGQAAINLAGYYDQVIATDLSQKQLDSAKAHPKVQYQVATSSSALSIQNQSVDLITVAQAFHWFNQPEFYSECKRVAKPEGSILALWCYPLATITEEIDKVVLKLYEEILGSVYWEKERKLVDECYRNESVPFKEVAPPKFSIRMEWSFEHLIGYLNTWSGLQKYLKQNKRNPIEKIYEDLRTAWGDKKTRSVQWELGLRVFKI